MGLLTQRRARSSGFLRSSVKQIHTTELLHGDVDRNDGEMDEDSGCQSLIACDANPA